MVWQVLRTIVSRYETDLAPNLILIYGTYNNSTCHTALGVVTMQIREKTLVHIRNQGSNLEW